MMVGVEILSFLRRDCVDIILVKVINKDYMLD